MASFEFLAIILTGLGLTASIIYYASILRNANKTQQLAIETRQAQLFMNLYDTYRSAEFRKQWDDVVFRMEWKDWDDFNSRYNAEASFEERNSWFSVATYFEGLGVLVKRNLIDMAMVYDLLAYSIKMAWERMGPIETETRIRFNMPHLFDDFEYLYNELLRHEKEASKKEMASI
jgi:hypothetical protein